MSRDREAGATPSAPRITASPGVLLPALALLASALAAALLAGQAALPPWIAALAMLLTAAASMISGALWSRQRQQERLREARLQCQALGQLLDQWLWQTDVDHRLVRLQPPQGAPASSWVEGAFSGQCLWERFDDAEHSLRSRMQAGSPLADLRVLQTAASAQAAARPWRLRGQPRFDGRGRFAGYLGVAEPTERRDHQEHAEQALQALLRQGPAAMALAVPAPQGEGWLLHSANPAALALLGLDDPLPGPLPWADALAGLPAGLRERLLHAAALQPLHCEGWQATLLALGPDEPAPSARLLVLARDAEAARDDEAGRGLAAEHAAFTYTVSHDLRAPIRVIEGFGRILKEDQGAVLDRVGNDHLDRMMAAAARMNHMIDALLSLSQLSTQPLAHHPVNLSQLAHHVVDELRRSAPGRQVAVRIAPGLSAAGDPTLLRMALDNLLGNAWKYSARRDQAEVCFESVEQDGRPVFLVRDNGAGFDMRFADRLFGVFQRLHSASDFQGTGVGLASVRRIVRRHGGEVWAESEVGQGARFYFTLGA